MYQTTTVEQVLYKHTRTGLIQTTVEQALYKHTCQVNTSTLEQVLYKHS